MKLNNIIYDTNTLGTAIQDDLINGSSTFNAMYPSQTATELVNVLAGYGSMLQYDMVSALMNCYTDTAFSPTGIYQLAETLGNQLHGNISSEIIVSMKRHDLIEQQTVVIPAGSIFNVEGLDFFNKEDIKFSTGVSGNIVNDVTLIQGTKNVTEKISNGIPGEKIYFAEDFSCNTNMVSVTVDGEDWEIIDTFLPLNIATLLDESESHAFVMRTNAEGKTYLKVGSGTNAIIPQAGQVIRISWVSNEGSKGNINKKDPEISLVTPIYYTTSWGKTYQLEVDISLTSTASGGFDKQSLQTLKDSSPYIFASGNRAVRRNDYKAILLNKCGYLTCNVWGEYEEAAMQGFYNKIMMNMVYFSGIKTYQKHDMQEISTLNLDTSSLNFYKVEDALVTKTGDSTISPNFYPTSINLETYRNASGITIPDTGDNIKNLTYSNSNWYDGDNIIGNLLTSYGINYNGTPNTQNSFNVRAWNHPWYYEISGNPSNSNIRGFLGSYEIELIGSDKDDNTLSLMYVDRYGTGILTLDYSINKDIIDLEYHQQYNPSPYDAYIIDDLGPDIYNSQYDTNVIYDYRNPNIANSIDPIQLEVKICNRDCVNDSNENHSLGVNLYNRYNDLFNSTDLSGVSTKSVAYDEAVSAAYICSGSYNGADVILSPVQPVQILISFPDSRAVANMPVTSDEIPEGESTNDYQKEIRGGVISSIIFKTPGTDALLKKFIGSFAVYGSDEPTLEYDNSVPAVPDPTHNYVSKGLINVRNSKTWDKLTDTITIDQELTPRQWTDWFTLNTYDPETNTWKHYKHYLIEVYSFRDLSDESGLGLAIGEIRATYGDQYADICLKTNHNEISNIPTILPGRSSTIYYGNNNLVTLRIPYKNPINGNSLQIPSNYMFYNYNVKVNNIIGNNYIAGEEIIFPFEKNETTVNFKITIVNPTTDDDNNCYVTIDGSSILKGTIDTEEDVQDIPLATTALGHSGATITITSESCVSLYANYIGNWYSNTDIQRVDLPTIEKYNHFTTYLEFKQPKIKNIHIDISVEYENTSDINDVKNNIINAIDSLFEVKPYSLGKTFNVSDLWRIVSSIEGVGRIIVNNPTSNITALPYELIALPSTNLTLRDITTYATGIRIKD